jgi:hypothetical protein
MPSLAEWGGALPSPRVRLKVSPDSDVRRPRAPVRAGVVRSCHACCLSAAPLPVHLRLCSSAPPRHRPTIFRSAQRLVSADERHPAGRPTSALELHLRRAASALAKPSSDAAGFSGELQSPSSCWPSSSLTDTTTRLSPTHRPSPTLEPPPSTTGCRSRRRLPLPEPRRCGGGGGPLR